jgi:hypothetical protein
MQVFLMRFVQHADMKKRPEKLRDRNDSERIRGYPLKKASPGIPRKVLQEPELKDDVHAGNLKKLRPLLIVTHSGTFQRAGVVQREHTHEAGGADVIIGASHGHGKILSRGDGDEILYILKCTQTDLKPAHKSSPETVQK